MILALFLAAAAAPVTIASKNALLDFRYSWSAEAAAIPALDRRFRAAAAKEKREALANARQDQAARKGMDAPWNGHYFSEEWETSGQSARLLSLESEIATFTGGAHGSSGTAALLWDRRLGREIARDSLLLRKGWWDGAIRQPFCTLLNRERIKRRQEQPKPGEMFWNCPELKELTLTLEDKNRSGRFDHVRVTADPYVAGPYVEGSYVIALPITATMVARVRPDYRASFEAQPPVQ